MTRWDGMSPQVRRFAALGLLAAVAIVLITGLLPQLVRWSYRSTEDLADARFELQRARLVDGANTALSRSNIAEAERELARYLISGANEGEASGNLHAVVDGLLRSQRLAVESAQPIPTRDAGMMSLIGVDWRGSGLEQDVIHAVSALEQAEPPLKIERVVLRSLESGGAFSTDGTPSRLSIEVRVVGIWASPAQTPSRAPDGAIK